MTKTDLFRKLIQASNEINIYNDVVGVFETVGVGQESIFCVFSYDEKGGAEELFSVSAADLEKAEVSSSGTFSLIANGASYPITFSRVSRINAFDLLTDEEQAVWT
jgi:hypothetical protein